MASPAYDPALTLTRLWGQEQGGGASVIAQRPVDGNRATGRLGCIYDLCFDVANQRVYIAALDGGGGIYTPLPIIQMIDLAADTVEVIYTGAAGAITKIEVGQVTGDVYFRTPNAGLAKLTKDTWAYTTMFADWYGSTLGPVWHVGGVADFDLALDELHVWLAVNDYVSQSPPGSYTQIDARFECYDLPSLTPVFAVDPMAGLGTPAKHTVASLAVWAEGASPGGVAWWSTHINNSPWEDYTIACTVYDGTNFNAGSGPHGSYVLPDGEFMLNQAITDYWPPGDIGVPAPPGKVVGFPLGYGLVWVVGNYELIHAYIFDIESPWDPGTPGGAVPVAANRPKALWRPTSARIIHEVPTLALGFYPAVASHAFWVADFYGEIYTSLAPVTGAWRVGSIGI